MFRYIKDIYCTSKPTNRKAIVNRRKYGEDKRLSSFLLQAYLYKEVGTSKVMCPSGLGY